MRTTFAAVSLLMVAVVVMMKTTNAQQLMMWQTTWFWNNATECGDMKQITNVDSRLVKPESCWKMPCTRMGNATVMMTCLPDAPMWPAGVGFVKISWHTEDRACNATTVNHITMLRSGACIRGLTQTCSPAGSRRIVTSQKFETEDCSTAATETYEAVVPSCMWLNPDGLAMDCQP